MNRDSLASGAAAMWRITDPLIIPLIPVDRRHDVTLLWRLDARLGQITLTGQEPALRQIRMRWWVDQLALIAGGGVAAGEPILGALAEHLRDHAGSLVALGEAWMTWTTAEDQDSAAARGQHLFALTAAVLGRAAPPDILAGQGWGIADAAATGGLAADAWRVAAGLLQRASLHGMPRALAALTAVSRGVAQRHGVVSPRRDQLIILRAGLLGR